MRETNPQFRAIIKIHDSEVVALMEMLHFMYGGTLSSSIAGNFVTLVDVMLLSDKFQVVSCTNHCIWLLKKLPMTPESAVIYLEIALHVLVICPLADKAKKFLATRYKDVMKFKEELCSLTLPAIEAIFNGEELQVTSEDCVYDLVMKWAQKQFPGPEERRAMLESCITRLVRFPYMSPGKLMDVLTSHDLDHDFAKDVVNEALFFQVDPRNPKWAFKLFLVPHDSLLSKITVCYVFSAMKKPEMDFMDVGSWERKLTDLTGLGKANLFSMPWETFIADDCPYFIDRMLHLRADMSLIQ
ncbi:BTB/POZ domain-containing protein POB1 [Acorus gramineus]|uniref:BTB/POZ domain-containing protein POB1 n=1 Tax=Acorus gramineus TaxID=55184 RepID=A0AAV9B4Y3_ACOGR|nr:BTB/POZ domain-containing protein POB1 [Acorus gramineus]